VDIKNKNGWNPLLTVCKMGDINLLKLLFDADVNLQIKNNMGENCISVC